MNLHARMTVACLAISGALLQSPARADRIPDTFDDGARLSTLWTELESTSATGCRVAETGGKLKFTGAGTASGAAYILRRKIDWNDGFVVDWSQSAGISQTAYVTRTGRVGLALGWGTFSPTAGFADGVNIEVVRSKTARRLVLSVRKAGVVVDSASCAIGTVEYDYRLVCSTGFGTSIDLFVDGGVSPLLSLDGLELIFPTRGGTGMNAALLAWSSAGISMDCRVDGFKFWGDQYDDSDDGTADDADSADDDDDKDGYDDSPDGSEEDDDSGAVDPSVTVAQFNASLNAALAASSLPVLQAEVERSGASTLVSVLQWSVPLGKLIEVRVNAATGIVAGTRSWVPSAAELSRIQARIDALPSVTVAATAAITSTVTGGATASEIELEDEDAGPVWKVKFVTAGGVEDETEVDAF